MIERGALPIADLLASHQGCGRASSCVSAWANCCRGRVSLRIICQYGVLLQVDSLMGLHVARAAAETRNLGSPPFRPSTSPAGLAPFPEPSARQWTSCENGVAMEREEPVFPQTPGNNGCQVPRNVFLSARQRTKKRQPPEKCSWPIHSKFDLPEGAAKKTGPRRILVSHRENAGAADKWPSCSKTGRQCG